VAIINGKVYGSKASAYQVLVRSAYDQWNQDGSVLLSRRPPLTAEFASHNGEVRFENPLTGQMDTGADIRGHFFDSAVQAEEKGWTQQEHDDVVAVLDRLCVQDPEHIWAHSVAKAGKPWPTYDGVHHNQVPVLAEQLGLVAEALTYEQQNANRASVVAKLSEILERLSVQEGAEEALTAA
jgi:hypothetical protein